RNTFANLSVATVQRPDQIRNALGTRPTQGALNFRANIPIVVPKSADERANHAPIAAANPAQLCGSPFAEQSSIGRTSQKPKREPPPRAGNDSLKQRLWVPECAKQKGGRLAANRPHGLSRLRAYLIVAAGEIFDPGTDRPALISCR